MLLQVQLRLVLKCSDDRGAEIWFPAAKAYGGKSGNSDFGNVCNFWIQVGIYFTLFFGGNAINHARVQRNTLHWPGIEPGPPAWQARILPLNHQCMVVQALGCLGKSKESPPFKGNSGQLHQSTYYDILRVWPSLKAKRSTSPRRGIEPRSPA